MVDINAPGFTRAVVALSRGGGDAHVVREFDMTTKQFVADGFRLPEAKSDVDFEDDDTWLVSTDYGEGSLTESGYPRLIKRWRRGTALEDAETVFSCATTDVGVGMTCSSEPGFERTLFFRMVDFYHKETFELRDGELIRLDIPTDCSMAVHREWAMILLISDWPRGEVTFKADSVLIADYEQLVAGTAEPRVVFDPDGEEFLAGGVFDGRSIPQHEAARRGDRRGGRHAGHLDVRAPEGRAGERHRRTRRLRSAERRDLHHCNRFRQATAASSRDAERRGVRDQVVADVLRRR